MINARFASGLCVGGCSIEIRETNTVVFPEPVGSEIPIRVESALRRVSRHACRHVSWYGRSCTAPSSRGAKDAELDEYLLAEYARFRAKDQWRELWTSRNTRSMRTTTRESRLEDAVLNLDLEQYKQARATNYKNYTKPSDTGAWAALYAKN